MGLTNHGKFLIAQVQFDKGRAFVGAALLLKRQPQNESFQYVYMHLVCQGIELILKGLLLFKAYDEYRSKEQKFGHNILKLAEATSTEFGLKPLSGKTKGCLEVLSKLFSEHTLRYSSIHDIFIQPTSLEVDPALRRLAAVIRLALRELLRARRSPMQK